MKPTRVSRATVRSAGRVLGALALVVVAFFAYAALSIYLDLVKGSHAPVTSGAVTVGVVLGAIMLASLGYAIVLIWRVCSGPTIEES